MVQWTILPTIMVSPNSSMVALNTTVSNMTSVPITPYWDLPLTIVLAILISLFMVAAIFGNGMVLAVIIKHKGMRTRTNLFLASLATADFLVAILDMPVSLATIISGDWIFNEAFCVFNGFTMAFFLITSIHTLMHISIHKYITITRPFSRVLNHRRVMLMISFAWLWGTICATLTVTGLNEVEYKPYTTQCGPSYPKSMRQLGHTFFITSTCYIIPLFVMIFCYFKMFQEIKGYTQRLQDHTNQEKDQVLAQQKRITITLFIVIAVFFLCWTPYIFYSVWSATLKNKKDVPYFANAVSYWFGYMNSACNPIIYALRSPSFREGFKEIMCQGRAYISDAMLDTEAEAESTTVWRRLSTYIKRPSWKKSFSMANGSSESTPAGSVTNLVKLSTINASGSIRRSNALDKKKLIFRKGQAYYQYNNHIYRIGTKNSKTNLMAGMADAHKSAIAKAAAIGNGTANILKHSHSQSELTDREDDKQFELSRCHSLENFETIHEESTHEKSPNVIAQTVCNGQENNSFVLPDLPVFTSDRYLINEVNLSRRLSQSDRALTQSLSDDGDWKGRKRSQTLDIDFLPDSSASEQSDNIRDQIYIRRLRERRRKPQQRLPSVEHLDLKSLRKGKGKRHTSKHATVPEVDEKEQKKFDGSGTTVTRKLVEAGITSLLVPLTPYSQKQSNHGVDNIAFKCSISDNNLCYTNTKNHSYIPKSATMSPSKVGLYFKNSPSNNNQKNKYLSLNPCLSVEEDTENITNKHRSLSASNISSDSPSHQLDNTPRSESSTYIVCETNV